MSASLLTSTHPAAARALGRYASIAVTGPDARTFLQGQLSFDMSGLTPQRMELASCNSAQGRVQTLLWMVQRTDAIVLIAPATMIDATIARLRKYVLRAKAKIDSGRERFSVYDAAHGAPPEGERSHVERDGVSLIRWPGAAPRTLMLAPADSLIATDPAIEHDWHLADIRAGLPQVYPQTHELFVAQMLNVDLLGGIGFEKGCYTGQEIIARTHFRGSVKRRTFRFRAACAAPAPGTRIVADGAHAGDVVDAVDTAEGCELLAVISLSQIGAELQLAETSGSKLERLELPYEVA